MHIHTALTFNRTKWIEMFFAANKILILKLKFIHYDFMIITRWIWHITQALCSLLCGLRFYQSRVLRRAALCQSAVSHTIIMCISLSRVCSLLGSLVFWCALLCSRSLSCSSVYKIMSQLVTRREVSSQPTKTISPGKMSLVYLTQRTLTLPVRRACVSFKWSLSCLAEAARVF